LDRSSPPFVLSDEEYELVESVADMIVPTGQDPKSDPGAKEVGVKNYFDSILFDLSVVRRERIRQTLGLIQQESQRMFAGRNFQTLARHEKEAVFRRFLSEGRLKERLLEVRAICIDGFYSDYHDPDYRGVTAWAWLGYEGKRISDVKKDWSFLKVHRARAGKPAGEDS